MFSWRYVIVSLKKFTLILTDFHDLQPIRFYFLNVNVSSNRSIDGLEKRKPDYLKVTTFYDKLKRKTCFNTQRSHFPGGFVR